MRLFGDDLAHALATAAAGLVAPSRKASEYGLGKTEVVKW
jgi:hypothetical protein